MKDDNDGRKLQWKCQMCLRLSLSFEHLNNCRTVVPLRRYWTAVLTLTFSCHFKARFVLFRCSCSSSKRVEK